MKELTNLAPGNPFPRALPNGQVVTNERCTCRHQRSGHAGAGPVYGHGGCIQPHCPCKKFTWNEHVFAPAKARGRR